MYTALSFLCALTYISFFFFNDTATTEIYTLSLHDALPICVRVARVTRLEPGEFAIRASQLRDLRDGRSEEHTSELQSRFDLVCRLLLEKKKNNDVGSFLSKTNNITIDY